MQLFADMSCFSASFEQTHFNYVYMKYVCKWKERILPNKTEKTQSVERKQGTTDKQALQF